MCERNFKLMTYYWGVEDKHPPYIHSRIGPMTNHKKDHTLNSKMKRHTINCNIGDTAPLKQTQLLNTKRVCRSGGHDDNTIPVGGSKGTTIHMFDFIFYTSISQISFVFTLNIRAGVQEASTLYFSMHIIVQRERIPLVTLSL